MELKGKVAIVTGGGRNIGRAISLALARKGSDIIIADIDMCSANKTSKEIEILGRKAVTIKTDITKSNDIENLFNKSIGEFNKVDILINNAGILIENQTLMEINESKWDTTMNVNLKSMVFLCKKAAEIMAKNKYGKIINVASVCGFIFDKKHMAYNVSKGAVKALTSQLAVELAPYNINVNAIAPGFINTVLNKTLQDAVAKQNAIDSIPLGRAGQPEDLGETVAFLASEGASYITGQTIVIDGGLVLL